MAYSSFLFHTEYNPIVRRCLVLLPHSSAERPVGWLQVLAVMNKAAMYIYLWAERGHSWPSEKSRCESNLRTQHRPQYWPCWTVHVPSPLLGWQWLKYFCFHEKKRLCSWFPGVNKDSQGVFLHQGAFPTSQNKTGVSPSSKMCKLDFQILYFQDSGFRFYF